jgi:hypothetical protein
MDADAFVADLSFNMAQYLAENNKYCFIAESGGSGAPWNVNAGVFFLNLDDADGRLLVHDWLAKFESLVPKEYLASHDGKWDEYKNDQALLYEVLKSNPSILQKTKKEDGKLFNYVDGRFIKQAIRANFPDENKRMNWIQNETRKILDASALAPA